jgi:predicted dehydrogenase
MENESVKPDQNKNPEKPELKRRTLLKALIGVPIVGVFAYELLKKRAYDLEKKNRVLKELDLQDIQAPVLMKSSKKGNLIRIGIVGIGARSVAHVNGLGYAHPDDYAKMQANGTLKDWIAQEDLNVAITGICDVFDLHAQHGIETAQTKYRAGGAEPSGLPVKRYMTFADMIADKDIDAVMIATPDHHHAEMAAAAARAGKHVYCEKSIALSETELNDVYSAVKNSNIVFQMGHQITQSVVFQQAKDIIRKNILGKITLVSTTTNRNSADGAWVRHLDANGKPKPGDEKTIDWNQWLGNTPRYPFSVQRYYNWQKYFDYETGMIGQLFTHEFDAVNQLLRMGIPKYVVSSGGIYFWKDDRDMPDTLQCVFEYPDRDFTLLYSATLGNSYNRGRLFMGHDATMELGNAISITPDANSTRYARQLKEGLIDPSGPMISFNPTSGSIDAVTSATEKYYASRGLTTTTINGRNVDVTYLHIREWLNCIRNGGTPSANIERTFEEGIACIMAHRSYLEHRRMEWNDAARKIV